MMVCPEIDPAKRAEWRERVASQTQCPSHPTVKPVVLDNGLYLPAVVRCSECGQPLVAKV
jgi:hypothetical protein